MSIYIYMMSMYIYMYIYIHVSRNIPRTILPAASETVLDRAIGRFKWI